MHYTLRDGRGSVRMVVDADSGDVAQRLDYDEFGNVLLDTNPGFQPLGYAGGVVDADTGLVHFGARDYDPSLGRWTTKDPLGVGGGMNVYIYVANDPINRVDVTGLAEVGDLVFFHWDNPKNVVAGHLHSAIVTAVDEDGHATSAYGAWGSLGMTYGEVVLDDDERKGILGYGDLSDLDFDREAALDRVKTDWLGEQVAPDWNGTAGHVCVDVITETSNDLKGYAGDLLRPLMRQDFKAHPKRYHNFWSKPLTPADGFFYRRVPTLIDFLVSTGRWRPARETFLIRGWGEGG
jgi:RHS repeat-associated protein